MSDDEAGGAAVGDPPERYLQYLGHSWRVPVILYRHVKTLPPGPDEFLPSLPDGVLDESLSLRARLVYGVSTYVRPDQLTRFKRRDGGHIIKMDLSRVGWAQVAVLRHGENRWHFEIFGEPEVMAKTFVEEAA